MELAVYTDEGTFEVFAEIMAGVPGGDAETMVCVTDDGGLTWTRSHWPQDAAAPGPESRDAAVGPASVAAAVVATLTQTLSCLPAGGQGHAA